MTEGVGRICSPVRRAPDHAGGQRDPRPGTGCCPSHCPQASPMGLWACCFIRQRHRTLPYCSLASLPRAISAAVIPSQSLRPGCSGTLCSTHPPSDLPFRRVLLPPIPRPHAWPQPLRCAASGASTCSVFSRQVKQGEASVSLLWQFLPGPALLSLPHGEEPSYS